MDPIVLKDAQKRVERVACQVNNCAYHDQAHYCTAETVRIGPAHASKPTDTICGTFRNKEQ